MSESNPSSCCCAFKTRLFKFVAIPLVAAGIGFGSYKLLAAEGKKVPEQNSKGHFTVHDMSRPKPVIVTPGTFPSQEAPGKPPSDAVVLFDGKDLSKFKLEGKDGDAKWKVENGYMEVTKDAGGVETREPIGDMQLHVEWAAPNPPKGTSQGRGNSGIYIMGIYEIQVLDTFNNDTYADGGATAVYGQNPPLVNACLPPGQWQTYDIIWRGPRFDESGKVTREATVTVLHNGVVTQDHYRLTGGSGHYAQPPYKKHAEALPLHLQNHGDPVRYRSIWYRPLPPLGERNNKLDWDEKTPPAAK
jgi:hypothetical protein